MSQNFTSYAFTPSVKAAQEKYGSRAAYAKMEQAGDRFILTEQERAFITSRDSFFLATVGENGWPYMQFRGGPKGFLKVLDDRTLGFSDFGGNRQFLSVGNLNTTPKACLFLIDYPAQERLKIWAEATVTDVADNPALADQLALPNYKAKLERLIVFKIQAYDWNCPQHITPRYTQEEIREGLAVLDDDLIPAISPDKTKT